MQSVSLLTARHLLRFDERSERAKTQFLRVSARQKGRNTEVGRVKLAHSEAFITV